jgi:Transposase DDE domain
MDNIISNQTVFSKCLSFLPFEKFKFSSLDNGVKKLTTANLMKICLTMQLGNWKSYEETEERIRAMEGTEELFGLTSISASQLCRRVNALPSVLPRQLFLAAVTQLNELTRKRKGIPSLGRLHLVDSSSLLLGPTLGKWTYFTKHSNCVKLHTRIVVTDPDTAYPDMVIPSTGNVDDREVMLELVTDHHATHVMDRGYLDYKKMDHWVGNQIPFAMRIQAKNKANIIKSYEIPDGSKVKLDALVVLGSNFRSMEQPLRLIEFTDEEGKEYRVVTNRWDLKAEEVTELYRHRWIIELFFKWMKQHLRLVKLQSTQPQGIWNQIFFAMTAYCVTLYVRLVEKTKKTTWKVLTLLRIHSERTWKSFLHELHRVPERKSKGRQKSKHPPNEIKLHDAGVAWVKPLGVSTSSMAKYMKKRK